MATGNSPVDVVVLVKVLVEALVVAEEEEVGDETVDRVAVGNGVDILVVAVATAGATGDVDEDTTELLAPNDVSGAIRRDLIVAPVALRTVPGIALVPPEGSESSKDVDRSGGILGQGMRTGWIEPGFFLS